VRDISEGRGDTISTTRLLTKQTMTEDADALAKMFETVGPHAEDLEVRIDPLSEKQKLAVCRLAWIATSTMQPDSKLNTR